MSIELSFKRLEWNKLVTKSKLERIMSHESLIKAKADYHANRRPRPCGLTIHSGIGCNLQCAYCYVEDMGFNFKNIRPYGLEANELAYSLLSNPIFFPTIYGTYLAFGSVTEPFHPLVVKRTLAYLAAVDTWLGNPCQFSTKFYINEDTVSQLSSLRKISLNPLITIITFEKFKKLEPNAPSPDLRLETIKSLRKSGLKPMLFLRPLIPGVNDNEIEELISLSKEAGAYGVVVGGFRVTVRILKRLESLGVNTSEIKKRMLKKPKGNEQISVMINDLKEKAIEIAKDKGIIPFKSACCANTYNLMLQKGLRIPCPNLCFLKNFCSDCPVSCREIDVKVDEEDVVYALSKVYGLKVQDVSITKFNIYLYMQNLSKSKLRKLNKKVGLLEPIFRKRIKIILK